MVNTIVIAVATTVVVSPLAVMFTIWLRDAYKGY